MTCSDFLARYSEFLDGETAPDERRTFRSHLEACPSCRRYDRVVNRGISLLRSMPQPTLGDDFKDRLRHSLYTIDEELRLRRNRPDGAMGGGAMAVVAAAVLVVAAFWTPSLRDAPPSVDLPAIVVDRPETRTARPLPPRSLYEAPRSRTILSRDEDFWASTNTLLFEYSTLYNRHRGTGLVRTGLN